MGNWFVKEENIVQYNEGLDATFHVSDLIKKTDKQIEYDSVCEIVKEELPVPGAFLLHNVLSPEECEQYIQMSLEMGYGVSPLRNLSKQNSEYFQVDTTVRNSERVLFDVPDHIGLTLNQRILSFLPEEVECLNSTWKVQQIGEGEAKGPINKRWRFNRYSKGQYFKPHYDAGYVYSRDEKTLMTFILYLNEGFEGGETIFYPGGKKHVFSNPDPSIECKVKPKTGTALIFFQSGELSPFHEGAEHHTEGMYKYILRSDLAYTTRS